jgi:Ca2+-binding EF-hand superfamily protein
MTDEELQEIIDEADRDGDGEGKQPQTRAVCCVSAPLRHAC